MAHSRGSRSPISQPRNGAKDARGPEFLRPVPGLTRPVRSSQCWRTGLFSYVLRTRLRKNRRGLRTNSWIVIRCGFGARTHGRWRGLLQRRGELRIFVGLAPPTAGRPSSRRASTTPACRHECRHSTHECVRHKALQMQTDRVPRIDTPIGPRTRSAIRWRISCNCCS